MLSLIDLKIQIESESQLEATEEMTQTVVAYRPKNTPRSSNAVKLKANHNSNW